MRCFCLAAVGVFCALTLAGCSGGGGIAASGSYNPGYGPFDRNGNYVEAWADNPARKHSWADRPSGLGAAATESSAVAGTSRSTSEPSRTPTATPRPSGTEVASLSRTRTTTTAPPRAAYNPPQPKPVVTPAPKPVSTPKPKPVKPKSPPPIRHTVKTGDTLYSLSRRYGTSVSAIQKANGLSGTTIVTGKTYVIPR